MAPNINIDWMGHCTADGSDKIWGICGDDHSAYTFWCRRGKTVKVTGWGPAGTPFRRLVASKEDRGYRRVPVHQMDDLHPGLLEQLESAIVLHKLRG